MQLRPYQQEAVDAVYDYLRTKDGNPCVVMPTASGKTPLLSTICRDAVTLWNGRVLVLSHVKELLQQAADKLQMVCPDVPVGVYSAGLGSRDTDKPVIVAGIQSVYKRACELDRFDLIIVDECFPTGTSIDTPRGVMNIEDIYIGQSIYNASGTGIVDAISARSTSKLVSVGLNNGKTIKCTPNHPFFTEKGWVRAGELERGAHVFCRENVRMLRKSVSSLDTNQSRRDTWVLSKREAVEQTTILFDLLFQNDRKSDVRSRSAAQDDHNTAHEKTTDYKSSGQWPNDRHSEDGASILERWLEHGIDGHDVRGTAEGRSAPCLQSRLGNGGTEICDRVGWTISSDTQNSRSGQNEDATLGGIRVERVESIELQSPVVVYNLQVSGHPSYFAEGILVHNCHLLPPDGEGMYQTFLKDAKIVNPRVRLIGLTATPYRLKSGTLVGPDNLLNEICYEVGIKELIEQGFLCPLRSKSGRHKVDCSELHLRAGEFIASEVDELMNTTDNVDAACREIIAQTRDRNAVLIFGVSVDHATRIKETIERFTNQECGLVTGDTPAGERDRILRRFKGESFQKDLLGGEIGPLKYLANVNVLTTGFDAPNIDCVVLLRPTASPGLYYQMTGRGFRLHESKNDCLVLDYGGNILRHGPVDAIQIKDKSTKGSGDAPAKECPKCLAIVHAAVAVCPDCGYEFPLPEKEKHEGSASNEGILTGEVVDNEYDVQNVYYSVHVKRGAGENDPRTMRVDYEVALNDHKSEWACPEHSGWARKKFEKWWTERSNDPVPDDADQAVRLANAGSLSIPTSIVVRKIAGEKFDRIAKHVLPQHKPPAVGDTLESQTTALCETCVNIGYDVGFELICKLGLKASPSCSQFDGVVENNTDINDDVPF